MALVKDYYEGNTHIQIYDDCCVKTEEEVKKILRECAKIALRIQMEVETRKNEYKSI